MNINAIEIELKKRLAYPYHWGRKQEDDWDRKTNFIYKTMHFESLLDQLKSASPALKNYALNRWYNYWSAMAVESIFALNPRVTPNQNRYDKLVDFKIDKIAFDHKTSVYPKAYSKAFKQAIQHKKDLIYWLYEHQSQQGRKHFKNRLFLVLYDEKGQHWRLKSDLSLLKKNIETYLEHFKPAHLVSCQFNQTTIFSDIIWVIKPNGSKLRNP